MGRVRRVVMIGSRATGVARPDSDLDLVILVEIPLRAAAWRERELAAECKRLYQFVGSTPFRIDISVRTTDQYEEGHRVVGGPEHLIATEGFVLHTLAYDRPAVVRRSPDEVRFSNVQTWIRHALLAADRAVVAENAKVIGGTGYAARRDARTLAQTAVERAINAVLVLHQVHVKKCAGVQGMLARLNEVEPNTASYVGRLIGGGWQNASAAYAVARALLWHLARAEGMMPLLQPEIAKLAKPVVLLSG
jgi:hypothetical protein